MKASLQTNGADLADVLDLLRQIEAVKGTLKEMGVLRSDRDATCDFAEWWAAQLCGLNLIANTVNADYDAKDQRGRTYQIKARRVRDLDESTSFNFRKVGEFDFLLAVFLERVTLEPLAVYCVPHAFVQEHLSENLRFRWHRTLRHLIESAGYGPVGKPEEVASQLESISVQTKSFPTGARPDKS